MDLLKEEGRDAEFAEATLQFVDLLLTMGLADRARASLRKELRFVADETMHEYRDVTPLSWGERFHDQAWVSAPVTRLIAERGGLTA